MARVKLGLAKPINGPRWLWRSVGTPWECQGFGLDQFCDGARTRIIYNAQYYAKPDLDRFQIAEPMPNSDLDQDLNWRPFKYLNRHFRCLTNIYTNIQHSVVTLGIWVLGYETPWTKTWVRIKDQFKNWTPTCIYSFRVYCIKLENKSKIRPMVGGGGWGVGSS